MMDKLDLLRTLIVALMIVLLVWDGLLWLMRQAPLLVHRDFLLTAFLLWFLTLFVNQNRDDDWAGQF